MNLQSKTVREGAAALNRRLEQLMPVLTPGGLLLGLLLPGVFGRLRPLVPALFAVMTLSGALKLQGRDLLLAVKNPLPALVFFVFTHALMPLLALAAGSRIFGNPDITAGFVLLFSSPTAVSGFIWVSIYRGDRALSLALILLDSLLAPLVMPGTVSLLLGRQVAMDTGGMVLSLCLMVVFPTIAGVILNGASRGRIPLLVSPCLGPLSKFCLTLVIAANAAAAAGQIHLEDPLVWLIAALGVVFAAAGFLGIRLAGFLFHLRRDQRRTLFFAGGLRNISVAAAMAIQFFPEAAALPAILGIVSQQTIAALMGKSLPLDPKPAIEGGPAGAH